MHKKQTGFTIVELLIVIVVIGILAAITIVAFNGAQQRARDTIRRDGAAKVAKAYSLWMAETGKTGFETGAGHNDSGRGFIQFTDSTNYSAPSAVDVFTTAGYLPPNFNAAIPPNIEYSNRSDRNYMLNNCATGANKAILLWFLEAPTAADIAQAEAARVACTPAAPLLPYAEYGMKNGIILTW